MTLFTDRTHAGKELAKALAAYTDHPNSIVLALPRGGVPIAFEIAKALHAPLDVFIVRKLGAPGQPELAIGAIASGGLRVMNDDILGMLRVSDATIATTVAEEQKELERREHLYRGDRPAVKIADKTIIVVDDGIATGATMRAAVRALQAQKPKQLIVAIPTAAVDTCNLLRQEVDEVVCLATPEPYIAVGRWYKDFAQTSDAEVQVLLAQSSQN
jgi:putative phosphoribosyl transferase